MRGGGSNCGGREKSGEKRGPRALREFLTLDHNHVKFHTTDVSDFEAGLLESGWKAKCALRDDALVRKLL